MEDPEGEPLRRATLPSASLQHHRGHSFPEVPDLEVISPTEINPSVDPSGEVGNSDGAVPTQTQHNLENGEENNPLTPEPAPEVENNSPEEKVSASSPLVPPKSEFKSQLKSGLAVMSQGVAKFLNSVGKQGLLGSLQDLFSSKKPLSGDQRLLQYLHDLKHSIGILRAGKSKYQGNFSDIQDFNAFDDWQSADIRNPQSLKTETTICLRPAICSADLGTDHRHPRDPRLERVFHL